MNKCLYQILKHLFLIPTILSKTKAKNHETEISRQFGKQIYMTSVLNTQNYITTSNLWKQNIIVKKISAWATFLVNIGVYKTTFSDDDQ